MGGDGGTKTLERKYLRQAHKQRKSEKPDAGELRLTRLGSCALSNAPLAQSDAVVACRLGHLYLKEVLLRHLLQKSVPATHAHLHGLSDVVSLRFHPNAALAASGERVSEQSYWTPSGTSAFACKFTGLEYNGRNRFCVVFPHGAVLSQRAVRELGRDAIAAEIGPFGADDVVELNQDAAQMERKRVELQRAYAERKKKKKKKKRKREQEGSSSASSLVGAGAAAAAGAPVAKRTARLAGASSSAGQRSQATVDAAVAARPAKSSSGHGSLDVAAAASAKVAASRSASSTFASLFHKDGEGGVVGGKNDHNLFIRVATHRGTT